VKSIKIIGSADVARLAGVSRSAVSRAFTPGAYIAPETRQRVLEAAETLHYQPNAMARSLAKKRSGLIGIIMADLENPFYAELLARLSAELQSLGYATLLLTARSASVDEFIERLLSYQVDGVILPAVTLSSRMAVALQRSGRPVVLVNNYVRDDLVSSVINDNFRGGQMVGDLLVRAGYRRIAYIGGEADTSSGRDRGNGLAQRLAESGLAIYAQESGEYRHLEAAEAARKLLSLDPRPDAIFCANDVMAVAALTVAKAEFGIKVPEDLAIVGYDNSDQAARPLYQLTTVDQHLDRMARTTIELMMKQLSSDSPQVEHVVVPATLVERATTRR
jgi:DNA-binding LacI/PurR family transcriptional regulator